MKERFVALKRNGKERGYLESSVADHFTSNQVMKRERLEKKRLEEKPEWQGLTLLETTHVLLEDAGPKGQLIIDRVIDKVKANSFLLFFGKGSFLLRALFYFKIQYLFGFIIL